MKFLLHLPSMFLYLVIWHTFIATSNALQMQNQLAKLQPSDWNLRLNKFHTDADGYERTANQSCKQTILPKLMLMGLPHAGSTLFAELLNMHPELSYGTRKEHHFFELSAHGIIHSGATVTDPFLVSSLDEYRSQFEVNCNQRVTFDGDPSVVFIGNSKLPRGCCRSKPGRVAVEELRYFLGDDMLFILIIRDPVDIINSISQAQGTGGASVEDPDNPVLHDMMCLADSLETWLSVFPQSQFLFLDEDAVFANITSALDRMLEFAKVSPWQGPIDLTNVDSGRRRASPMNENWRKAYNADPRNLQCKQRLESLTGLTFRWNSSVTL